MDGPRTLLISPFFDAAVPSGGVLFSIDMAHEWLRRGRSIAVLCAQRQRALGDLQPFVDCGQLKLIPVASEEQVRFTHHAHEDVHRLAARAIEEFQPQVIHAHNIHGMLSAVRAGIEWARFCRGRVAARAVARGPLAPPVILTALDFGLLCFNFYLNPARQCGAGPGTRVPGSDHLNDSTPRPCDGPASAEACARCVRHTIHGPARWLGPILPRSMTRRIWPRFVRLDQTKSAPELHAGMHAVLGALDAIIAPSPIMAGKLTEYGAAHVQEILYGVAPEKTVRPPKTPSNKLRLAYLGSDEPVKGFHIIAAAVERLPDGLPLEIRAMGNDAVRQRIVDASDRVRRYIRYHPPLFGRKLAEEHARIDAVLAPSLWHENSPFVVLESLANGTPVFAADQAGIRHLIDDGRNGWLIQPHNIELWTTTIASASAEQESIRRMQRECHFTRTTADFVNETEQLESTLMAADSQPAPIVGFAVRT